MILEALKALFIGIVEGITEWLPISSTGHMILVDEFVKLDVSDQFLALFLVVIQLGAIMAVILLYFHKLNPFSPKKTHAEKRGTWRLWGMVAIGCIPAAIVGLLLDDWVNEHFYNAYTVAIMLVLYGVVFIVMERLNLINGSEAARNPDRDHGAGGGHHQRVHHVGRCDSLPHGIHQEERLHRVRCLPHYRRHHRGRVLHHSGYRLHHAVSA